MFKEICLPPMARVTRSKEVLGIQHEQPGLQLMATTIEGRCAGSKTGLTKCKLSDRPDRGSAFKLIDQRRTVTTFRVVT